MIKKMLAVAIALMMMGIIGCNREKGEPAADKSKDVTHEAATATKDTEPSTEVTSEEAIHDAPQATEETAEDGEKSME